MTVTLRPALAADRQFVLSGWSSSLRMSRDVPLIAMADWSRIYHEVIGKIIDRPGVAVLVAEGSVLQGFLCFEADYVLYVYVAQPFRRNGLARALFAAAGIDPGSRFRYACRTKASWECRSKYPLARYDPFPIRYPPGETK